MKDLKQSICLWGVYIPLYFKIKCTKCLSRCMHVLIFVRLCSELQETTLMMRDVEEEKRDLNEILQKQSQTLAVSNCFCFYCRKSASI